MNSRRRAARYVWALGACEVLLFGSCALIALIARSIPLSEIQEAASARNPHVAADQIGPQIAQIYGQLLPVAVIYLLAGFLPGLVYVLLGFGVRAGKSLATNAALLLAITQAIVFGILAAANVFYAVMANNLTALTVNVIMLGSLLMVLGFTIRWLFHAKLEVAGPGDQESEPWNNP